MERQQRGFWESGGAQVRWPLPGMAHNYMAVCRHKGSRGKQKGAGFYKKGKEKESEIRHENTERKAVDGLGRG